MHTPKQQLFSTSLKALDALLMLLALAVSLWLGRLSPELRLSLGEFLQLKLKLVNVLLLLLFSVLCHLIFLSVGLYDTTRIDSDSGGWKTLGTAVLISSMVLLTLTVISQRSHVSRTAVLLFAGFAYLFVGSGRATVRGIRRWMYRHHRHLHHLLLVGSNQRAYDFAGRIMTKPHLGYHLVGYVDEHPNGQTYQKLQLLLKHLGTLEDLDAVLDRESIDEVMISLPIRSCYEQIQGVIATCEIQGIRVHLLPDFFQLKTAHAHVAELDHMPLLTLASGAFTIWPAYVKRAFDLVVSVPLVLILSPVFLLIALLIKLSSPDGPIFFVQTRVGYNRRRFKMFKFRTMVPNAPQLQAEFEALNEAQGPVFKIKNDPRITRLGQVLRKMSLDELPQLFNVIQGDMSLVGPRPLPLRDVERFEEPWLKRRFSVKPGITCLWQINGRSDTNFDKWITQDLEYIDHWSFGLDMKILLKTIPAVLRGTGAH